jgi:S-adenosylhomocysteine hydrolase
MFPILPVLEKLLFCCPHQNKSVLSQTVVVCVQHILSTTGSLFQSLIKLGVKPSNIFILGKCYSTNSDVLQEIKNLGINVAGGSTPMKYGTFSITMEQEICDLWSEVYKLNKDSLSKKMIIIDDGGKCLNSLPYQFREKNWQVVGIEQTTSGLNLKPKRLFKFPLIEVASSAAKKEIESPMIAEAVSKRICHAAASINATSYGIVGYGNIGRAVSAALSQQGYKVSVFDKSDEATSNAPKHISRKESIRSLIDDAQFVLGCTGEDILPDPEETLKNMSGQKIFASCSSGDYEFKKLLRIEQQFIDGYSHNKTPHTLQDTKLHYSRGDSNPRIKILRGGFPVNFDGSHESAPSVDIQLTRGLLLGAVIQATLYFEDLDSHTIPNQNSHKMLDPYIQRMVVDTWQQQASYKSDLVESFQDIEWIRNNSGGKRSDSETLKSSYSLQCSLV